MEDPSIPAGLAEIAALIALIENKDRVKAAVAELTATADRAEKATRDARVYIKAAGEEIAKAEKMTAEAAAKMAKANELAQASGRDRGMILSERGQFEIEKKKSWDDIFAREASVKAREEKSMADAASLRRERDALMAEQPAQRAA